LSIMCGGTEASVAAASPIIAAYSKRIVHVGGPGTGQITKMCNQIAFAGVIQSLSEALRFAQSAELDVEKVYEAISGGAAQSWQMDNRWATMAEDKFDFGFAVDWMRKDLGLAFEEARAVGATLPITAIIDQFYADVQHMGGGRLDTSAIVKRLPKG
jgi:3-hydroxyisobutyrate dehydrogenase